VLEHQQVNNYWCNFLFAVLQQVAASLLQVSFVSIMGVRAFNRVIWVCFQMVRLATFIAGKIVAVDVSVFMHAILSDEIVSRHNFDLRRGVRVHEPVVHQQVHG
jgi:hypothetical protein